MGTNPKIGRIMGDVYVHNMLNHIPSTLKFNLSHHVSVLAYTIFDILYLSIKL